MKLRLFILILPCLIFLLPFYCTKPVSADTDPNRLALAISGGASMGAYEAGLIWGLIEIMRQEAETGVSSPGGRYKPIEISSIAGTSAGGINTLLAALTWMVKPENQGGFANRIDDNIFRDVWLTPDVNRLLPPKPNSPLYLSDDALLSRKDLVDVSRKLREKWLRPGTFLPGLTLPLGVTVTRVKPDSMHVSGIVVNNQRFYIPFELRTQRDGSAKFYFNPEDYPSLTDPAMILMPWTVDGAPFFLSDQQVEDALLTTSAFPTGFGRKRLQYCRQKSFTTGEISDNASSTAAVDTKENELVCPDDYELAEAEFADGGLFDNLPIGLARTLSELNKRHLQKPLPIRYIYLDPERVRYKTPAEKHQLACEGDNPPEACREMTFDLASEAVVLGGAIGTARRYELFRELTSETWRLNLPDLCYAMADMITAKQLDVDCSDVLPFFDGQPSCSERLRSAGQLLDFAHSRRFTPIFAPLSARALTKAGVAGDCRLLSGDIEQDHTADAACAIKTLQLRKQLINALTELSTKVAPEDVNLRNRIGRSALSMDADRLVYVTSRGGPITGLLLGAFGAFLEYKFREFDYFVGIYDAAVTIANIQCERSYRSQDQKEQFLECRDQISEALYRQLGIADHPKSRYMFALMARQEFGRQEALRFAYDPMPPEDRDIRIIFEGLSKDVLASEQSGDQLEVLLATEHDFFKHLKAQEFEPTPPPDGGKSLLTLIMDDPDFWAHELVNRATSRLVYLEKRTEKIYRKREPDPNKRETANTTLMGAAALVLRTTTYKYPKFSFAPSTAPENWFWRYIIPYEMSYDLLEGDFLIFWQPTLNYKHTNVGLRFGLGFTGGVFNNTSGIKRENYGTVGVDFTWLTQKGLFSGIGLTPAVYHNWNNPEIGDQTTFGLDVHANFLNNRLRIGFGARDLVHDAGDTVFLTVGIADLPGLVYWLSR